MLSTQELAGLLANGKSLIIDGALATELETRGHDLSHALWSGKTLLEDPDSIRQIHYDYYVSGADIGITASYQASICGLQQHLSLSETEAKDLVKLSATLAQEARQQAYDSGVPSTRKLFVAGSVGPYGAYLADGSEYRGDYTCTADEFKARRRRRSPRFGDDPQLQRNESPPRASSNRVPLLHRLARHYAERCLAPQRRYASQRSPLARRAVQRPSSVVRNQLRSPWPGPRVPAAHEQAHHPPATVLSQFRRDIRARRARVDRRQVWPADARVCSAVPRCGCQSDWWLLQDYARGHQEHRSGVERCVRRSLVFSAGGLCAKSAKALEVVVTQAPQTKGRKKLFWRIKKRVPANPRLVIPHDCFRIMASCRPQALNGTVASLLLDLDRPTCRRIPLYTVVVRHHIWQPIVVVLKSMISVEYILCTASCRPPKLPQPALPLMGSPCGFCANFSGFLHPDPLSIHMYFKCSLSGSTGSTIGG
jgi:hypothetical protein